MSKKHLIKTFRESVYNGQGEALYSNCGWGYVYESVSKNETIRVGIKQIIVKQNDSDFPFFEEKYELTIDEFNELSQNLPRRYKKLKNLSKNEICTVRNKGSVNINKKKQLGLINI